MNLIERFRVNSKRTVLLFSILFVIFYNTIGVQAATYTVRSVAGSGGSISPSGDVPVSESEDISFTITPFNGHVISNINIDGISVGAASSYTIYGAKRNSKLAVTFLPETDTTAETIYVDNSLTSDCLAGEYSVSHRDHSGNDGKAFTSIGEAANIAGPGDTIYIRAGTYNKGRGNETDVLWPKHSGTAEKPIVFKPYNNEKVVIGEDPSGTWPNDSALSISRGAITMRNVHYIHIENLIFYQLGGWLFARNCSNITIKNCWFERAMYGAKGGARLIECHHCRFINNTFLESAYDAMMLVLSDYNLLENNTFDTAGHSVLTLRSASYNVIRNNRFRNPRQKLVEVFDQKLDTRESLNPSYIPVPAYNDTQHNVFESNIFGYHPYFKNRGAQPSAMQYSGQGGIIRKNVFSNPVLSTRDPKYPNSIAGGTGINMRWGGSWTGWNGKKILGEAHEAGYVTQNRIYHNVFRGYDFGQVYISSDDAMKRVANPPPMKNVRDFHKYRFDKRYAFEDNIFKNNAFSDTKIVPHMNWTWLKKLAGRPVQVILRGRLHVTYFNHNNFFTRGPYLNELIYDQKSRQYYPACSPKYFNATYGTFSDNTQKDPLFVDPNNNNFNLQPNSPMIDAGGFLTIVTSPSGSGDEIMVEDAAYFYDGYNIPGEVGDIIRLEGHEVVARIVDIDYDRNILKLSRSVIWKKGQGVSLNYVGNRPDVGAFEFTPSGNSPPVSGSSLHSPR